MMQIIDMTLSELSAALKAKKVSSVEATKACLDRIEQTKSLNNFITICPERALAAAEQADKRIAAGEYNSLMGVPLAIKDNICVKGVRTTCASKILDNFVPPYSATAAKKLEELGAVTVGKTNMDEFAMGSTDENSAFGPVHNVHDFSRVPGGSSGGSANCVAAKQVFGALGSDTGGSIRQPASYCGVVGLKPTYSAVSRNGLVAFASSLDQIGPLARTCDDALLLLKAIVGRDECDTTSAPPPTLPEKLTGDIKGRKIGVADEFTDRLEGDVRTAFDRAVEALKDAGANIVRVSVKAFDAALAVYYVLSSAEATSNLARYDGVKYGRRASRYTDISDLYTKTRTEFLGDEVKRRIMIGNYVLSSGYYDAYYLKASKMRTLIKREYDEALSRCDVLLCPTAPTIAPVINGESDPAKVYLSDIYTVPVNIAGLPAASVPFGRSAAENMPIGVQIIGKTMCDGDVLQFGKALEMRGEKC